MNGTGVFVGVWEGPGVGVLVLVGTTVGDGVLVGVARRVGVGVTVSVGLRVVVIEAVKVGMSVSLGVRVATVGVIVASALMRASATSSHSSGAAPEGKSSRVCQSRAAAAGLSIASIDCARQ